MPTRIASVPPRRTPCRHWLARLARDIVLWLRAPAGNRPDWGAR